jgi:hypothetical protein
MNAKSPAQQLAGFIARFRPEIAVLIRAARAKMRKRLPRAVEMVYDNYNALVIGFGPTERASEAIVSIVAYPRWVSLCFLQGAHLPDPLGVLTGAGNQVRHIRLDAGAAVLDTPVIRTLISEALKFSGEPFDGRNRLVIKAICAKQRPRRAVKALPTRHAKTVTKNTTR